MYYTKKDLREQIMTALAGRCAEEIKFGADYVTTGASNDIEKATNTAKQYVTKFGMGTGIADLSLLNDEKKIAQECIQLLNDLYKNMLEILQKNKHHLDAIAEELLLKETLDGDAVKNILQSNNKYNLREHKGIQLV